MAYTTEDIILWGKISQPYAVLGEKKHRATLGSAIDKNHDVKLYMERKSVEWYNSQEDPDSDLLYTISNWLFALEGIWGIRAQFIDGGSGGIVAPVTTGSTTLPDPIDWEVIGVASGTAPLADGDSTVTLNGTNGMPNLRGYNIEYTRNGVVQNTTNIGGSYYSWNRTTAVLVVIPAATFTELMRILPTR